MHIIFMVHGPYFKAFRTNFGRQKVTKQIPHTGDTESLHNNGYEFCKIIWPFKTITWVPKLKKCSLNRQ